MGVASPDDVQETELIGGVEQRELLLLPYDQSWINRFEDERQRIAEALGPKAAQIEHIGSTAVPGWLPNPSSTSS